MTDYFDVVVVGAGAAGIGAGLRLARSGASFVLLEARDRVGGRAHTIASAGGPLDLGCEWLHSARDNIWTAIAEASGFHVERLPAPWERQTGAQDFPQQDQWAFR